jgi:hypothetical protein
MTAFGSIELSPTDPNPSIEFLHSGQSAKYRFFELLDYKADVGGLNLSAKSRQMKQKCRWKMSSPKQA